MLSTKKSTMMLKHMVSGISVAAFLVIVAIAGPAAAANNPRPKVISSSPLDNAMNVSVDTAVTVFFSIPIDCKNINRDTFRLDALKRVRIVPSSITCAGTSATLTPQGPLANETRYRIKFIGTIRAMDGRTMKPASPRISPPVREP